MRPMNTSPASVAGGGTTATSPGRISLSRGAVSPVVLSWAMAVSRARSVRRTAWWPRRLASRGWRWRRGRRRCRGRPGTRPRRRGGGRCADGGGGVREVAWRGAFRVGWCRCAPCCGPVGRASRAGQPGGGRSRGAAARYPIRRGMVPANGAAPADPPLGADGSCPAACRGAAPTARCRLVMATAKPPPAQAAAAYGPATGCDRASSAAPRPPVRRRPSAPATAASAPRSPPGPRPC